MQIIFLGGRKIGDKRRASQIDASQICMEQLTI
jgi:hypothetical protein